MTTRGMCFRPLAAVAGGVLLLTCLSACGSAGSDTTSAPPLSFAQRSAALLTAAELPAGYTAKLVTEAQASQAVPSDLASALAAETPGPCAPDNELNDLVVEITTNTPSVIFYPTGADQQSGPPALQQAIYDGPKAKDLLDTFSRFPTECARWKTGDDDDPESGEVGDEHQTNVTLPFPELGDATTAYTQGLLYTEGSTEPAESLEMDFVAIRRGNAVIFLSRSRDEVANGMVLPLEELARTALDRYDAARLSPELPGTTPSGSAEPTS